MNEDTARGGAISLPCVRFCGRAPPLSGAGCPCRTPAGRPSCRNPSTPSGTSGTGRARRGRACGWLLFSLHRRAPRKRGFSYAATPNALREAVGRGAAPPSPRLRARGRVQRPRPLDPSRRPCAVSNIPRASGLVGEPSAPRPIENRAAPSHSRRRGAGHGKPPSSGRLLTSPALLENPGLRPRPSASSPRLPPLGGLTPP